MSGSTPPPTAKFALFFEFKYTRAVKQKIWNEAENGDRDWEETLTPRFTDFFTDFEKRAVLRYLLFPLFGQTILKTNHQYKLYHEIISGEKAASNMIY